MLLAAVLIGACEQQAAAPQSSTTTEPSPGKQASERVSAIPVAGNRAAVAAGESISGMVTDNEGRPLGGAIVAAAVEGKTVARYTDTAGQYQIPGLASGRYEVTVDALGFALATQQADPAQEVETNFTLSPEWDLDRLESAELTYLLPDTEEALYIYNRCSSCHGLQTPRSRAGMPATAWQAFLPFMTVHRWGTPFGFTPERVAPLAPMLGNLFGPEGALGPNAQPDFSKIKRVPLQDTALQATLTEYRVPAERPMIHSVTVDDSNGIVWFSEYDALTNNIARFDPETETFQEFPIPLPEALAHTGTVMRDGRFIVALDRAGHEVGGGMDVPTKLAIASADGTVETVDYPGKHHGARVVVTDPTDDDIVWVVAEDETWRFNVKTKEFKAYENPAPDTFPEGSYAAQAAEVSGSDNISANGYAMTVDAQGTPWVTQINLGIVLRLNPDTGEWKSYHTPEMQSARGIDYDSEGNIWFGDFFGHQLGKLDPESGEITFYPPPNPNATPYGITVDRRNGYVWYGDTHPNNATRFDPRTGEFVEYPLISPNAAVRFLGIDPDGRAWYGGFWNGKFGVVDPGDTPRGLISSQ